VNDSMMYDEKPKRDFAEIADLGNRFLAMMIDGFIVGIIVGILSRFGAAGFGLSFVCSLVYTWYFLTRYNGQTPGKMVMHIRVVRKSGEPIDDATAVVRAVMYHISWVIVIGILWATWDKDHQGWHDKLANTLVVKA
jgi:uncharacterized RDD family membrane protein YckC